MRKRLKRRQRVSLFLPSSGTLRVFLLVLFYICASTFTALVRSIWKRERAKVLIVFQITPVVSIHPFSVTMPLHSFISSLSSELLRFAVQSRSQKMIKHSNLKKKKTLPDTFLWPEFPGNQTVICSEAGRWSYERWDPSTILRSSEMAMVSNIMNETIIEGAQMPLICQGHYQQHVSPLSSHSFFFSLLWRFFLTTTWTIQLPTMMRLLMNSWRV